MISTVISALNEGFAQTLKLFFVTLVGALPLGLLISFGSMSTWAPFRRIALSTIGQRRPGRFARFLVNFRPVSLLVRLIVWVVRGTPLMLQLIIIFYIPGTLLKGGSPWPAGDNGRFLASAIAFILNYACYFSEIYRGGIQGVPAGQQEAGQVLGMTKRQIFFKVTLLQMVKRIVPPISNEVITLVKDTAIARVISLQEVIWAGYSFLKGAHGYSGLLWPLFCTGIYYLIFNGIVTLLLGKLEKKLDYFR